MFRSYEILLRRVVALASCVQFYLFHLFFVSLFFRSFVFVSIPLHCLLVFLLFFSLSLCSHLIGMQLPMDEVILKKIIEKYCFMIAKSAVKITKYWNWLEDCQCSEWISNKYIRNKYEFVENQMLIYRCSKWLFLFGLFHFVMCILFVVVETIMLFFHL